MSTVPATPRSRTTATPATPTARLNASTIHQSSPHYTTTRRHSLYGTEDRVVIDPGSRIWKIGFSGEGRPRDVFYACDEAERDTRSTGTLWTLDRAADMEEREEEERTLEAKLQERLRSVFHDSLMTEPKSRKIIVVEHPLLPLYIKEMLARVLFKNLQVPSISFAPSSLLALLAAGRITGLVLDSGHLESTVLPIFAARPLFPHLRTTPLAGSRLSSHLRALLLLFGTYLPPPTSLSAAANIPAASRSTRVPEEVLSGHVIEEIKTRACLVASPIPKERDTPGGDTRVTSPGSESMDLDAPPSSDITPSESGYSLSQSQSRAQSRASTSMGMYSQDAYSSVVAHPTGVTTRPRPAENHLQALSSLYTRYSTATDLRIPVNPPSSQSTGTGRGTLVVPGWIRERAAEVLFDGGDVDEGSVAEIILDSLLKVPVDLRKTMASSILVVGGTPMLPGFIPRLHAELVRAVSDHASEPPTHQNRRGRPALPTYDRYAPLRPLLPYFAILNNPSPPAPSEGSATVNAGKAPAFAPATMAWVGGSLAGSLKTGGMEVPRERWDESDPSLDRGLMSMEEDGTVAVVGKSVIPDWTRTSLPAGAPSARAPHPSLEIQSPSPPGITVVGA